MHFGLIGAPPANRNVENFRIQDTSSYSLTMAIGSLAILSGLFILLASYQVFSRKMNVISGIGGAGKAIGYGVIGVGIAILGIGKVRENNRLHIEEGHRLEMQRQEAARLALLKQKALCQKAVDQWTKVSKENQAKKRALKILDKLTERKELQRQELERQQEELRHQQALERRREGVRIRKAAALVILRAYRRYVGRVHSIQPLFFKARKLADDPRGLDQFPHPSSGREKYRISMPHELSIIIRQCNDQFQKRRITQMREARTLCLRKGLTRIIIPKASAYKNYQGKTLNLEERMPNENSDSIKGMMVYADNFCYFTEAAVQFFLFRCFCHLSDIIGNNGTLLNHLVEGAETPRFDNLLLYMKQGVLSPIGNIAVIDIESFRLGKNLKKPDYWNCIGALSDAIQLFPYAFHEIMAKGRRFYDIKEAEVADLEKKRKASAALYELLCHDTVSFYERNGITFDTPSIVAITPERHEVLKQHMGGMLLKIHRGELRIDEGWMLDGCLGEDPKRSILLFQERLFPGMIIEIEKAIKELYDDSLQLPRTTNYADFIHTRMVEDEITPSIVYSYHKIPEKALLFKEVFCGLENEYEYPITDLFEELFYQLVGHEVIAYKKLNTGELLIF